MSRFLSGTIAVALVASLLLHVGLWKGLDLMSLVSYKPIDDRIEIEVLDPDAQKKVAQTEKENLRQIVEQGTKSVNEEEPEDAKYLSRFNQKVEKQTKARNNGDFTNAAQPGQRTVGQQDVAKKERPVEKKTRNDGDLPSLKDLTPSFSVTPKADSTRPVAEQGLASQTNDYLPDVEEGPQTILNTREFIYFAYYQRIRDKIRQYWEPAIRAKVERIFASGRSIASASDRVTKVIIVLNQKGSLIKVQIIGESGIHDLDEAAVEAFKAAEPFPNPPDGIIEEDGTIRIRWDFVLEASSTRPGPSDPRFVSQR